MQLRDHRRGRPGREAQRPLELRCRLAVRGQLGRLPRGGRGVPHRGRPVPRALGVKGQPGVVVTSASRQGVEDPGVDKAAAMRRDRLLHRQPGYLVAKPQPGTIHGEQPGREGLVDGRRRALRDRLDQPQFGARPRQRGHVQHSAGRAAEPYRARQHRIPRRRRISVTPAAITAMT